MDKERIVSLLVLAAFSGVILLAAVFYFGQDNVSHMEDPINDTKFNGFVDISDRISDNPSRRRYGIASIELDNQTQFYVTAYDGSNSLMRWSGDKLVEDTPQMLKDPQTNAIGAAGCDIDGDGNEEIYVLTTGSEFGGETSERDRLYSLENGEWKDLYEDSDVHNNFSGRSVACTYTPYGYGFFVARYGGPMQLIVEKNGTLEDVAPEFGMDRVTGGRSIVNIPGSNGTDIFVGNERGQNFYFERKEDGYAEKAREYNVADPTDPARGVTVLDINKTGVLDLAIAYWNAEHKIYKNRGDEFENIATEEFEEPTPARSLIAYDFNNDGSNEIFLNNIASRTRAPNKIFDSHGNQLEIGDAEEPRGLGTGASVADIDNDGSIELLVARGETGSQPMTMYEAPTESNSVRIQPVWKSGAPARNTLVELKQTGEVKVVDGGSAYLNQMEPWVHFGDVELPAKVKIKFPDGSTVEREVEDREVTVDYGKNW